MAKTAVVRARMEPELKEEAERVLERLGIKPSEAINMFYVQLQKTGALPFQQARQRAVDEYQDDMRRLEESRSGNVIAHDSVEAWLRSIGTNDELPCPVK